jgi:hypothetical protein
MAAPKSGDLEIGESYFGIDCSSCGEFIPLQRNLLGIYSGLRGEGPTGWLPVLWQVRRLSE